MATLRDRKLPDWLGNLVKSASRIFFLAALIAVLLMDLFVWRPN